MTYPLDVRDPRHSRIETRPDAPSVEPELSQPDRRHHIDVTNWRVNGLLRKVHSATPARSAAGVAFEAGAVAYQGEVAALSAALALVTLDPGFRPQVRCKILLGEARLSTGAELALKLARDLLDGGFGLRLSETHRQFLLESAEVCHGRLHSSLVRGDEGCCQFLPQARLQAGDGARRIDLCLRDGNGAGGGSQRQHAALLAPQQAS